MIFQDPFSSLNPVHSDPTTHLERPLRIYGKAKPGRFDEQVTICCTAWR